MQALGPTDCPRCVIDCKCSEIIEELQQQVKVAAATSVVFTYQQTSCDALKPVLLVKDNIFNISCKKVGSSILSCAYFCCNKQCKIVVARTSESKVDHHEALPKNFRTDLYR